MPQLISVLRSTYGFRMFQVLPVMTQKYYFIIIMNNTALMLTSDLHDQICNNSRKSTFNLAQSVTVRPIHFFYKKASALPFNNKSP
jgi:hypothetical protein